MMTVKIFGHTETDDTQVSCVPTGADGGIPEATVMHPAAFKKSTISITEKWCFRNVSALTKKRDTRM